MGAAALVQRHACRPILFCYRPDAIGRAQRAPARIQFGNLLYTAGQIPIDPESGALVGETIEDQTRRVLENLQIILPSMMVYLVFSLNLHFKYALNALTWL